VTLARRWALAVWRFVIGDDSVAVIVVLGISLRRAS
jgi:hypothetical protein